MSGALNNPELVHRGGLVCSYCGLFLTESTLTRDHVVPRSQGGDSQPWNLVNACRACNYSKSRFTPLQWLLIRCRYEDGEAAGKILRQIQTARRLGERHRQLGPYPRLRARDVRLPKPAPMRPKAKRIEYVSRNGIRTVVTR